MDYNTTTAFVQVDECTYYTFSGKTGPQKEFSVLDNVHSGVTSPIEHSEIALLVAMQLKQLLGKKTLVSQGIQFLPAALYQAVSQTQIRPHARLK